MNGLLGSVLPLYLVAANVVTFLLYGLDKARARRGGPGASRSGRC